MTTTALHVAVLGGGMAGLAAAQRASQLGHDVALFEKNDYIGGHTYSHVLDGFTFDEGPHISFTKNQTIKDLLAAAVDNQFLEHRSLISNLWQNHWVKHPAQCNLYGLPVDVVQRCLVDFAKARCGSTEEIKTYADWCYEGLGRAFSEEFTFPYTLKYWTTDAANMSTDWVGPRMYAPSLDEVVRGALAPNDANFHYLTQFRYPTHGGFNSYVRAVVDEETKTHLGHELVSVDLRQRKLEFANGRAAHYESLISSLPLPELIRRIKDVPQTVADAAGQLVCTSVVVVNVGVKRDEGFQDAHWMYFYDKDVIFARANFPHRLSPNNVPKGCGSVQVEVYHSKYQELPCADVLNRSIEDMRSTGLLRRDDEILIAHEQRIPYANVLFDLNRAANLAIVQTYLNEQNVKCCGRYGEWAYYWTDDSILSGWRAAENLSRSSDTSL